MRISVSIFRELHIIAVLLAEDCVSILGSHHPAFFKVIEASFSVILLWEHLPEHVLSHEVDAPVGFTVRVFLEESVNEPLVEWIAKCLVSLKEQKMI